MGEWNDYGNFPNEVVIFIFLQEIERQYQGLVEKFSVHAQSRKAQKISILLLKLKSDPVLLDDSDFAKQVRSVDFWVDVSIECR